MNFYFTLFFRFILPIEQYIRANIDLFVKKNFTPRKAKEDPNGADLLLDLEEEPGLSRLVLVSGFKRSTSHQKVKTLYFVTSTWQDFTSCHSNFSMQSEGLWTCWMTNSLITSDCLYFVLHLKFSFLVLLRPVIFAPYLCLNKVIKGFNTALSL